MNVEKIRKYLQVIERAKQLIEQEINDVQGTPEDLMEVMNERSSLRKIEEQQVQIKETVVAPSDQIEQNIETPLVDEAWIIARKKHVEDLMAIECWPEAVRNYLVPNEEDKSNHINRANAILDSILDCPIENLNVLDYGCGDGWVARQAALRGANVTGYDIVKSSVWDSISDKVKFTDDVSSLKEESYDIVILYDVLDHCKDPVNVMQKVKSLLRFGKSTVYVRCHPWTSRHATSCYKQGLNKAYVHLFLKDEEIQQFIKGDLTFTRKEKFPLDAYSWWFHDFKIAKERIVKDESLSAFFLVPSFVDLIKDEQGLQPNEVDGFFKNMEIQFVDYKLTLN